MRKFNKGDKVIAISDLLYLRDMVNNMVIVLKREKH